MTRSLSMRAISIGIATVVCLGCSSSSLLNRQLKAKAMAQFESQREQWRIPKSANEKLTVQELDTSRCIERINRTLSQQEKLSCIRAGSLEALKRVSRCLEISVDTGYIGGAAAYFDKNGDLLLVWLIPEG